jgi:hypothetical protein
MNRGKTLYIPDYYSETIGDPESGQLPPGAIDTSGLELLSFHIVSNLSGVDEGSTLTFVLKGTNNGDGLPNIFGAGPVPLLASKIDGWAPLPSIATPDITLDLAAGSPAVIAYKELPRYVWADFARSFLGESLEGTWKVHVFGWMV